MKISVCIPMYNESAIIADSARTLHAFMEKNFVSGEWEVIFIDDGSRDGCGDIVRSLNLPGIRVIGYEKNRGKGYAVRTGVLDAEGDIVMYTDADLAYGTEIITRVVQMFDEHRDAELVIGSRNLSKDGYDGYTFIRRLASKTYIKLLCLIGDFRLSDSQCSCKAFRRDAGRKIFSRCEVDRFAFDFEVILYAVKFNMKIVEMPVKVLVHGESKVHLLRDAFKMLSDIRKMKKRIKKQEII